MAMSSDLPIIIIGCPRSGTTLLRRLIGAHPRLDCPGESFLLRAAVRFLRGERVAEGIDYGPLGGLLPLGFEPEEVKHRLREFVLSFHAQIAARAGKPRFAIKTAVDAFYLPQILDLFGGHARFVCLIRHGGDVAVSLSEFTQAMEGPIEELMPFIEQHRRLMNSYAAAWAKVTGDMLGAAEARPDDVFAMRYEDLVEHPEQVLEELFAFLSEPCDLATLHKEAFKPRDVVGLGDYKTFATHELDCSSVGRWRNLPARVQAEIAPILNPLLQSARYEPIEAGAANLDAMRLHELAMMYRGSRGADE
jgi:hypothetical protein